MELPLRALALLALVASACGPVALDAALDAALAPDGPAPPDASPGAPPVVPPGAPADATPVDAAADPDVAAAPARCSVADVALCEDFETDALGAPAWSLETRDGAP